MQNFEYSIIDEDKNFTDKPYKKIDTKQLVTKID